MKCELLIGKFLGNATRRTQNRYKKLKLPAKNYL